MLQISDLFDYFERSNNHLTLQAVGCKVYEWGFCFFAHRYAGMNVQ